jgi:DNA-binding MarR family transcriptional regulator
MNKLFFLLKKTNGLMFQRLNDICLKHGLSGKQYTLLRFFYQNQDSQEILQAKIQKTFRLRRSTITSVLQTLEKKGMIIRKTDGSDQRKKVIILTGQAKDLIERIEKDSQQNDSISLSILNEEEYNTLINLLERICDNLVKNSK